MTTSTNHVPLKAK